MKTARNLIAFGIGLGVSAVVGWFLLKENKRSQESPTLTIKSQIRPKETGEIPPIVLPIDVLDAKDEPAAPPPDDAEDDLTRIKDIGPRFAEALRTIGITRFAQLAQQTPEVLAEQLAQHVTVRAQRIREKDWIGQAAQLANR